MDNLHNDMSSARLDQMRYEQLGPIFVLRDIRKHIPDEVMLAEKISKELNEREWVGVD